MDPADVSDQVVREVDELFRVNEHAANENRSSQVNVLFSFFLSYSSIALHQLLCQSQFQANQLLSQRS